MCGREPCETCDKGECEKPMVIQRPDDPTIQGYNYDFSGNDVRLVEEYRQQLLKQMTDKGWRLAPITIVPSPDPGDVPQRVPSFVEPQDKLLVWLATLMYKPLPMEIPGATLNEKYTSSRIGVWTSPLIAYVAFRGTDVSASDRGGDLLDDLAIATGATCDVSITVAGVEAITRLYNEGFTNIQLCGHSLGGRGALCCGSLPGVTKVVVINAAAPFLQLVEVGPGEEKATHYHIFGDLISSHLQGARNVRVRVGVEQYTQRNNKMIGKEELYQVNWLDPYYHSTDRFLNQDYWEYSTPQEEQDSLETFFFSTERGAIELLSILTSTVGFPFAALIKTKICENLVPGAKKYRFCNAETSVMQQIINSIMKALGAIIGGIVGFLTSGTPDGAVEGARVGMAATSGNLGPLVEKVLPGFSTLSKKAQGLILDIFTIFKNLDRKSNPGIDEIKHRVIDIVGPRLPVINNPPLPTEQETVETFDTNKPSIVFTYQDMQRLFGAKARKVAARVEKKIENNFAKVEFKINTILKPDGEKLPIVKDRLKKTLKVDKVTKKTSTTRRKG